MCHLHVPPAHSLLISQCCPSVPVAHLSRQVHQTVAHTPLLMCAYVLRIAGQQQHLVAWLLLTLFFGIGSFARIAGIHERGARRRAAHCCCAAAPHATVFGYFDRLPALRLFNRCAVPSFAGVTARRFLKQQPQSAPPSQPPAACMQCCAGTSRHQQGARARRSYGAATSGRKAGSCRRHERGRAQRQRLDEGGGAVGCESGF